VKDGIEVNPRGYSMQSNNHGKSNIAVDLGQYRRIKAGYGSSSRRSEAPQDMTPVKSRPTHDDFERESVHSRTVARGEGSGKDFFYHVSQMIDGATNHQPALSHLLGRDYGSADKWGPNKGKERVKLNLAINNYGIALSELRKRQPETELDEPEHKYVVMRTDAQSLQHSP